MERPLLIIQFITGLVLIFGLTFAQERWILSAEIMESTKINGQEVRRLNENVRFVKTDKVILADNAAQYIKDDVLHLNGNTIMINGLDTLTCDSMVYWSKLDSGYAMGNVRYIQPEKDRKLTTDVFHYWQNIILVLIFFLLFCNNLLSKLILKICQILVLNLYYQKK